jgi:hypothetical protein
MRITSAVWLVGAVASACGGAPGTGPRPDDPSAAVVAFLAAVKDSNLAAMGEAWGRSDRGPGNRWEDPETLHKRLVIMRSVLVHDRYEILSSNEPMADLNRPVFRVRLFRNGCEPVVPFTVVPYQAGWLVEAVELAEAGNPARRCR